ncbi:MAG: response regulator [Nitrospirales bacterium]|nr:response regulator [Nitrospirales bacterium]
MEQTILHADNQEILIVEDSPVQATMLRRILTQHGYKATIVKHGGDALPKLREHPFGLVIGDVEMPVMNGYELCVAIKADEQLQDVPVMLLTSLASPTDLMKGLNAGADSYVTKPYDEEVLLARVGALLKDFYHSPEHEQEEVVFAGEQYTITATRQRILNLLLSTYENARQQNRALTKAQVELTKLNQQLEESKQESEQLLMNILPKPVAEELIAYGSSTPAKFDDVSILFTDFIGFTKMAEQLTPQALIDELSIFFNHFDTVVKKHRLEKLKTIGDSYMVAGGLPKPTVTHPMDCILAGLEMQQFLMARAEKLEEAHAVACGMRVGIHTGPVVAGVIGKEKFAYDVWGDAVNLASRMESSGEAGRINISCDTYERVKDWFSCEPRGKIQAKNKGEMEMYFVHGLKPEFSEKGEGLIPNAGFLREYKRAQSLMNT